MTFIRSVLAVAALSVVIAQLHSEEIANDPEKQGPLSIRTVGDQPTGFNKIFTQQVVVFGLSVYATAEVSDADVMHAAGVLAQYLDNNEDGRVDNPLVLKSLREHQGCMVMFPDQESADRVDIHEHVPEKVWDAMINAGLWGDETHPNGSSPGKFDATLEEVLHLVTSAGYSMAYPEVFGERGGTEIAKAMDKARGGRFLKVPSEYPSTAWYSYDDRSCDYRCQITEYFYWGLTSLLGAQDYPGRGNEIHHEWKLNTRAKLKQGDTRLYELLTNPKYNFPTKIPNGRYRLDKASVDQKAGH